MEMNVNIGGDSGGINVNIGGDIQFGDERRVFRRICTPGLLVTNFLVVSDSTDHHDHITCTHLHVNIYMYDVNVHYMYYY